jgi:hypothetical protein
MSDLTEIQASGSTKIVGASSSGSETNYANVNSSGELYVTFAKAVETEVFGAAVGSQRNNQVEINFETVPDASYITTTTSGGGSIAASGGHTAFSTGTATTALAKAISVKSTTYRPGNEVYAYFTAAFTTPTNANSYQRIGLYDAANGFYIGYNGTSFGVTKRTGSVDTFSAINKDPLNGSATSEFTRNGTPEAINLTYSNIFRIRFGWLGSGNVFFEVFSPDAKWVVFHEIKQPNTALNPSIQDPNLNMTCEVSKTSSDATNLQLWTGCWAAGTASNYAKITDALDDNSLTQQTRSVIAGRSSTGGGTYYNVKVTPSGSLVTALGDISDVDGQQPMATSLPVVIASNQSPVDAGVILGDQYVPATPDTGTTQTKLLVDPDNQLKIRGDVLTDEGTFRDDFSGVALNAGWTTTNTGNSSIAVASSNVTLSSGTQSGNTVSISQIGDYGPISFRTCFTLSQRIANQTTTVGFIDDTEEFSAYFEFTGTNNTQVNCVTKSSSAASDTQTTLASFPANVTSASACDYYIEVLSDQVSFNINGYIVAQHKLHIPGPYDTLNVIAKITNAAVVTNTALAIDYVYFINQNSIQVNNSFDSDPLSVKLKTQGTQTFGASIAGFGYANNGTDIFTISGSATKTIRIKHISVDGTQTTGSVRTVLLIKRSTANTGGTSTVLSAVPYDSLNSPATAVVRYYTTNPTTLGTTVGQFHNEKLVIGGTNATDSDALVFETQDTYGMQDITLRGANELLAINMNAVTSTGNSMNIDIAWTEE